MVPRTFLFIFHAGSAVLLIVFKTQVIKKKRPVRLVSYDYNTKNNNKKNNNNNNNNNKKV